MNYILGLFNPLHSLNGHFHVQMIMKNIAPSQKSAFPTGDSSRKCKKRKRKKRKRKKRKRRKRRRKRKRARARNRQRLK